MRVPTYKGMRTARLGMRPAFLLPFLLLPASLVVAAAQEPPPGEEGTMLHMLDYKYAPDPLEVPAGSTVITMNFGPSDQSIPREQWGEFTHSVTAVDGSFDMQNIPPDFAARTFTAPATPGTYPFYCRYHGDAATGMRGTLIVTEAAPEPTPSTPSPTPEANEKRTPVGALPLILGAAAAGALLRSRSRP